VKGGSKDGGKPAGPQKPPGSSKDGPAIPYPPGLSPVTVQEAEPAPTFTEREKQVGGWLAEGKSDPEIAGILSLGLETVRTHIKKMREKTDAVNRNTLLAWIWRNRLIFHLSQSPQKPVKYT
jgi:DNA-binding CsgD family transcriptional regulator